MNPDLEILKKDRIFDSFVKNVNGKKEPITLEDLYNWTKDIQLIQDVSEEAKEIFETSKKLFVHGYFYYHFFTVSQHYAFLALESALCNKYKTLYGKEKVALRDIIEKLTKDGIIPKDKKESYDAERYLRNALSHLAQRTILAPNALVLTRIAELINTIYLKNRGPEKE